MTLWALTARPKEIMTITETHPEEAPLRHGLFVRVAGDDCRNNFSLPGAESQQATDLPAEHGAPRGGDGVEIIRCLIVLAAMQLMGHRAWWLPAPPARLLPTVEL